MTKSSRAAKIKTGKKKRPVPPSARKPKRGAGTIKPTSAGVAASSPAAEPVATSSWLLDLAVEWWRLDRWAQGGSEERIVARHVARRIRRILDDHEIAVVDPAGSAYEAGLALEVVDVMIDALAAPGAELVGETIAPIVLSRGNVVRHGQIVLVRGS